jgi:hypothetical protein
VDPAGNAYVTGTFGGQANFGPYTVNPGNANGFVAKLDPGGNFLWVDGIGTTVGGDRGVSPAAIAVDAAGNAYVAGDYCGTIDFNPGPGTVTLSSANRRGGFPSTDAFVWKLTASGGFGWAKSMGGDGWDGAKAIALDAAGGVYVAGTYGPLGWRNTDSNGNNDYDPGNGKLKLPLFGGSDVFVEKFNANGSMVWTKAVGGAGADAAAGIAVDGLGRVVVTGTFSGSADFNPGSATHTLSSQGGTDGFVLALDAAGGFLAAAAFGGAGDDGATAVAIGSAGRIRATGYFAGSATFGPFDLTAAGGSDLFLVDLTLI